MRICVQGVTAEKDIRIEVVRHILELKTLQLCPQDDDIDDRLLSVDHFSNYLKVYLSGGFVSPDIPVVVKYLAKTIIFTAQEDNVDKLKRLNLSSNLPVVYSLAHGFNVSFVENFR